MYFVGKIRYRLSQIPKYECSWGKNWYFEFFFPKKIFYFILSRLQSQRVSETPRQRALAQTEVKIKFCRRTKLNTFLERA